MAFFDTGYKAIIVDTTGPELSKDELDLFRAHKPLGFILFQRHCVSPTQVRELTSALRESVGNPHAPILIDQEGGTVARLKSPAWHEFPSARLFGELADKDPDMAFEAVRTNSRLMAAQLADLGVSVNCAPVCDVPSPECHGFLATHRTYSRDAERVAVLSDAVCEGLLDGGITPVIKHIPGHGRAKVDSHYDLPIVDADINEMQDTDFAPFRALSKKSYANGVWAMAAHVLYSRIDAEQPASTSRKVVETVIRNPQHIGFDGVVIADDISMKALKGTPGSMARATLDAGMDLTMLCNGSFDARIDALENTAQLSGVALARIEAAEAMRQQRERTNVAFEDEYARINDLLGIRRSA